MGLRTFKMYAISLIILVNFLDSQISDVDGNVIPLVVISGTKREMGVQYGKNFQVQMLAALRILKDFYVKTLNISYELLVSEGNNLFQTFDSDYQHFIEGVAEGSDGSLSQDDVKVLNAQETFVQFLMPPPKEKSVKWGCAFIFVPCWKTITGSALIGRNYDYEEPYDKIGYHLSVVILKETNRLPVVIIGLPGQIYCPTCINSKGIFMELNNGGIYCQEAPEGNGSDISILSRMLVTLQESKELGEIRKNMHSAPSNYCLIVNVASAHQVLNFEFNRSIETRTYYPEVGPFASTNYFLNPSWGLNPLDRETWNGVTRRRNLLNLIEQENGRFDVTKFKQLMDRKLDEGGARVKETIFQVIFDPMSLDLYVKITANPKASWEQIPLKAYLVSSGESVRLNFRTEQLLLLALSILTSLIYSFKSV